MTGNLWIRARSGLRDEAACEEVCRRGILHEVSHTYGNPEQSLTTCPRHGRL